jgi:hypothetical protein
MKYDYDDGDDYDDADRTIRESGLIFRLSEVLCLRRISRPVW